MNGGSIGGLVLAAGAGRRFGMPKLRLTAATESYLRRCVRILSSAGAGRVACVVSPAEAAWAAGEVPGVRLIVNASGSDTMLSSVRLGVDALASHAGILLMPVDHPHVKEETVRLLVEAAIREPGSVIKPVHGGAAGHPIVVPREAVPAIRAANDHDTLRGIIAASKLPIRLLDVDDPGVLQNINTAGDLNSLTSTKG